MDIYAKFELGATLISPAPTSWDIPRLLFWCFIFCLFSFYAYWGLHVLLCLLVQIEWLVLVFCYVCPKRCSSLHCTWQIQWNRLSVCRVYDKVFCWFLLQVIVCFERILIVECKSYRYSLLYKGIIFLVIFIV